MSYREPRFVYFMKPIGMAGPIKIGCSSVTAKRLEELSVWSPFPLEIVATVKGGYDLEQKLHGRFACAHSHREWFEAAPELVSAIAAIASGIPVDKAVDLTKVTGSIRTGGKGARVVPEYRKGLRSYSARIRHAQARVRDSGIANWHAPQAVDAIMSRWNGWPYRHVEGKRPTPEEFQLLDAYLADPGSYSEVPSWERKKRAA